MAAETTNANGTKSKACNERARSRFVPHAPSLRTPPATGERFAELASRNVGRLEREVADADAASRDDEVEEVPAHPALRAVEVDLRTLREIHREGCSRAPKSHEPIFVIPTGLPLVGAYPNAKRFFADAMERAGLKPLG
jgi:hypothetical protein